MVYEVQKGNTVTSFAVISGGVSGLPGGDEGLKGRKGRVGGRLGEWVGVRGIRGRANRGWERCRAKEKGRDLRQSSLCDEQTRCAISVDQGPRLQSPHRSAMAAFRP